MNCDKEHLKSTAGKARRRVARWRDNALSGKSDPSGMPIAILRTQYRTLAINAWINEADPNEFSAMLLEAALCQDRLFDMYSDGSPIDSSFLSMLSHRAIFEALAGGDFEVARRLASKIGGRPDLELKQDHPLDRLIGYALKYVVLGDEKKAGGSIEELRSYCRGNQTSMLHLCGLLQAISMGMSSGIDPVFESFEADYCGMVARSDYFEGNKDACLCLWGIGLARLAVGRGMLVNYKSELIPAELITWQAGTSSSH